MVCKIIENHETLKIKQALNSRIKDEFMDEVDKFNDKLSIFERENECKIVEKGSGEPYVEKYSFRLNKEDFFGICFGIKLEELDYEFTRMVVTFWRMNPVEFSIIKGEEGSAKKYGDKYIFSIPTIHKLEVLGDIRLQSTYLERVELVGREYNYQQIKEHVPYKSFNFSEDILSYIQECETTPKLIQAVDSLGIRKYI